MHEELYELKEKLIKELGEYSKNGKYSKDDVETIKYLASAVDHLCNIAEDMDEGSYDMGYRMSRDTRGGGMDGYYSRTGRGSYARGRRRDSRGRYSSAESVEDFMITLGEMMGDFPEEAKRDAEKLMRRLKETM